MVDPRIVTNRVSKESSRIVSIRQKNKKTQETALASLFDVVLYNNVWLIRAKSAASFQCNNSANTRGHEYKLYKSQHTNRTRTNLFANGVVSVWNSLPYATLTHL